ncbi:M24 family metallopeptidase [Patescibacteria group bacterium]|nr:M24 family metallopeptidase [Patescibacteria group bacterium]
MIRIKTKDEIELMRQGGKILAQVLGELAKKIKPGITTKELDELAENLIYQHGALPGFKGFNDYPTTLCTSINEEIVHALPSSRRLKEGDIIGLDLGVLYPPENCNACAMAHSCGGSPRGEALRGQKGLYTDAAITVAVGNASPEAKKIIEVAKGALAVAIDKIKPGRKLSEVSVAIENFVKKQGLAVIRELIGHGVGYELHEDPEIPNFDFSNSRQFKDAVLKEGMTLAIEPMVAAGSHKIKKSKDKFGYLTEDDSLAAHFEHTVAVTEKGCEILTKI